MLQVHSISPILDMEDPENEEESKQGFDKWNESLTSFQKLILIKAFEEEKVWMTKKSKNNYCKQLL